MVFFGFLLLSFGALLIYTAYLGQPIKSVVQTVAAGGAPPERVPL